MKNIIKYVADDGTIFEDEDECYEYELSLRVARLKDRVRLFDEEMNELQLTTENFENFYHIAIYDVTAIAEVKAICEDELGVYHPWHRAMGGCKEERGLYMLREGTEWYNSNSAKEENEKILSNPLTNPLLCDIMITQERGTPSKRKER